MTEKKDIYRVSAKEMRGLLIGFNKTVYGRTVFIVAYFLPLLAFFSLIGLVIMGLVCPEVEIIGWIAGTLGVLIVSFLIGTGYYYRELREFVNRGRR